MPFPWLMNPELSSYPKKSPLFYCSSAPVSILLGASLVEGSSSLASFPSFGVFSSCVERLRGQSARWSLPSSPVSLPLPLVYRLPWLTRLLASMTHQCAFFPLPLCLIASSWLPKCWWSKRGSTWHSAPFCPWVVMSDPTHLCGWCLNPVSAPVSSPELSETFLAAVSKVCLVIP